MGLPDDHRWDGNRGGLPTLTPLLIHKIQIAMHPGHLVRGEAVGAVIICGDKKGTGEVKVLTCKEHHGRGEVCLAHALSHEHPAQCLTLTAFHQDLSNDYMYSSPESI